uniref:Uncharacterized protein n=1 Tax=Oncorhynchus kisutch TaxID=8019 RepID=A0A8C7FJ52_ONCKI
MEGVRAEYFSIPPPIKQNLVKQLPLESMCLETGLPALGPEKQTGVRNEPKNISVCAEYISKVKEVPLEMVMEVTTQSGVSLFPRLNTLLRA